MGIYVDLAVEHWYRIRRAEQRLEILKDELTSSLNKLTPAELNEYFSRTVEL